MAVKGNEKAVLQQQWEDTEAAAGANQSDLPDGIYQFEIMKVEPASGGKMSLVTSLKVVGGNDQMDGEAIDIRDNLDTSDNMGWFKQKLKRLGIDPADWTDLDLVLGSSDETGTLGAAMVGLRFEGQKKSKGGFDNVYVNKLIQGAEPETATEGEETTETAENTTTEAGELEPGMRVTFTSQKDGALEGEVTELLEGEDGEKRARITADNGKKYNVPIEDNVAPIQADEQAAEPEEKEEVEEKAPAKATNGNGRKALPKHPAVKAMKMPEIKVVLAGYKIDSAKLTKPREFLQGVAGMVHNPKYTPDMAELAAMCAGLNVKKQTKPSETVALVRKAVAAKFGKN